MRDGGLTGGRRLKRETLKEEKEERNIKYINK